MQLSDLQGHYINLDGAGERRQSMQAGLTRHGLDGVVTRFGARQGDDRPKAITRNELGCFLSHHEIVTSADPSRPLLVLEDDIHFPEPFGRFFRSLFASAFAHEWDMLFLNKMISFTDMRSVYHMLRLKRKAGDIYAPSFRKLSLEPCKGLYVSGAGAYLVRPAAIPKLAAILERASEAGYKRPLDMVYLDAINRDEINARFVFPYILGIDSSFESTINDRPTEANTLLFNDILNLFVAGGDLEPLRRRAFDARDDDPFDVDAFIASQIIYRRLLR